MAMRARTGSTASGTCGNGTLVTTCPADQCHVAVACNASTGCPATPPAVTDGTVCNDGNPCTTGEACHAGSCNGGAAVTCTASDGCHTAYCDSLLGGCQSKQANDGTACTMTVSTSDVCSAAIDKGVTLAGGPAAVERPVDRQWPVFQ